MRVGIGFDIHQLVQGRPLILAGVTVPFDFGLAGHSDADVIAHAVIDAVLGAAAAGDIGDHFPDNDSKWENARSLDLLAEAIAIVRGSGYRVSNVDVTVLLEEPRLGPYKKSMRQELANALGLGVDRVSVKAKTAEGLGFIGRKDGIAAQAIALVEEDEEEDN